MAQKFPWQIEKLIVESAISSGLSFDDLPANVALFNNVLKKKNVTPDEIEQLMDDLERLTGRTDLAIVFAQAFIPEFVDDYFLLGYTASNLKEAIQLLSRYKRMLHPSLDLVIEEDDEFAHIIYRSTDHHPIANKYFYSEAIFSCLLNRTRDLTHIPIALEKIAFRHEKTSHHPLYPTYFGCPVIHNQPEDVLTVRKDVLYLPFHTHDPETNQLVQAQAESQCHPPCELVMEINRALMQGLSDPEFGIEKLASALYMSQRSLQRKLNDAGYTFSKLKSELRITEAKKSLEGNKRTLEELAEQLGFVNAHSLRQFFKKQTGMTISEYRATI